VTSNTFADERSIPCGFRYGSTFFIKFAKKDDQLFAKEVAYKIENMLNSMGYSSVKDINEADYCLVFNFDMLGSKHTRDVLRQEPDKVATKKVYSCQGRRACDKNLEYEERIVTPGEFFYVKEDYILYKKELFIEVYDSKLYRDTKKQEQLWGGYSSKSGESADLRSQIDYLLISAFKYFGRSTKRNLDICMNDKEVKAEKLRFGLL
jgi:hypothetical protein